MRKIVLIISGLITVFLLSGCGNVSAQKTPWVPNPQFTGVEYLAELDSLTMSGEEDIDIKILNKEYRSELMFKKDSDIQETPFVKAVVERYNRMSFQRYLNSELQIIQRYEGENDDLSTTEIDLSPEEMAFVVQGNDMSPCIKSIEKALSEGDFDKFWEEVTILVGSPFTTEEPVSDEDLDKFQAGFDKYYDKSVYVKDIERFYRARITDSDSLDVNASEILERLPSTSDFDTRCILALEYSKTCVDETGGVQWLGDLLESGEYSKYLYEVWMQWKYVVQRNYFGISSYSIIPDMYYEKVRNLVLNTMLRYIQNNPDDLGARVFAFNLAIESNVDRMGSTFGNMSLVYLYELSHRLFVPEDVVSKYYK